MKAEVRGSRKEAVSVATAVAEAYLQSSAKAADERILLKRLAGRCMEDRLLARRLLPDNEEPRNIEAMEQALARRNHASFIAPFGKEEFKVFATVTKVVTHYGQMVFGIALWTAVALAGMVIVRRFSNSG